MKHLEANLQRSVVTWLRYMENQGKLWFTHIGHGGGGRQRGAILKGLGLKPGVADLMILMPGGRVGFLELKAPKGRVSESQETFRLAVDEFGGYYAIANSLEMSQDIVEMWLTPYQRHA